VRYNGSKGTIALDDSFSDKIEQKLKEIQLEMFINAKEKFASKLKQAETWAEFMDFLNNKNIVLTPWCNRADCEKEVKEKSKNESK